MSSNAFETIDRAALAIASGARGSRHSELFRNHCLTGNARAQYEWMRERQAPNEALPVPSTPGRATVARTTVEAFAKLCGFTAPPLSTAPAPGPSLGPGPLRGQLQGLRF